MDFSVVNDHWEILDLIKAVCSLIVGMILGAERELKDKAAGLRTITLICLGSTLFTLLSYKIGMGSTEDATRIASYVVSGIGFLGAGVIFKDGISINGLTTASIIWVAAAIGMSIGFGEFFMALTFLGSCLIIIHFGGFINKKLLSHVMLKNLQIEILKKDFEEKYKIEDEIKTFSKRIELRKLEENNEFIILTYECKIFTNKVDDLERFLVYHPSILGFKI